MISLPCGMPYNSCFEVLNNIQEVAGRSSPLSVLTSSFKFLVKPSSGSYSMSGGMRYWKLVPRKTFSGDIRLKIVGFSLRLTATVGVTLEDKVTVMPPGIKLGGAAEKVGVMVA